MKRIPMILSVLGLVAISSAAFAEDQTVTLDVENMTCALCPVTVSAALKRVDGVRATDVSLEEMTAVVTFDDALTNVAALTEATTNAGFPSALKEE